MRDYNGIEKHVNELREAAKDIRISFRPGYDSEGCCLGIRGAINDIRGDSIIVDNIAWLIAGDIYDKANYKPMRSMHAMKHAHIEDLVVHLRAQATVCGGIMTYSLGNHTVAELQFVNDELGYALLKTAK